jgi:hypothetical protein
MKIIKLYALGLLLISSFNVLGTTCNIIDSSKNTLRLVSCSPASTIFPVGIEGLNSYPDLHLQVAILLSGVYEKTDELIEYL